MMTASGLRYAIQDVLEWNHQWSDASCPWCGAESYGVDGDGQPADDGVAEYFVVDHEERCAVTLLEAVLHGGYAYLNPPPAMIVPPMPEPNVWRLAGSNTMVEDLQEARVYLRRMTVAVIDRVIQFFEVWREICR